MTKILSGRELAGFVKERQSHVTRSLRSSGVFPKLAIIRNSDDPVINKYVTLKKHYAEDIGIAVDDIFVDETSKLITAIETANQDPSTHGIIVQLPLSDPAITDDIVSHIDLKKDVDGLSLTAEPTHSTHPTGPLQTAAPSAPHFDSATATAINWLLAGHDIDLSQYKIAIVGKGRLVGRPLIKMWRDSGHAVTVFDRSTDLKDLINFNLIVTATGHPHLIKSEYIQPGSVLVDAGTASESGHLVGDLDDAVRERTDLKAITPISGGVGPLTVSVLFENVLSAATKSPH